MLVERVDEEVVVLEEAEDAEIAGDARPSSAFFCGRVGRAVDAHREHLLQIVHPASRKTKRQSHQP